MPSKLPSISNAAIVLKGSPLQKAQGAFVRFSLIRNHFACFFSIGRPHASKVS